MQQGGASSTQVVGANATGTIIINVPSRTATSNAGVRHTAYVSAGTTGAAVFIDGATAPAGSTTTCTTTCTIPWSAALVLPSAHSFAIEVDNGAKVLAEGVKSYAIVSGNNGTLATMTLNGVAANAAWSAESCVTPTTTCTGTLTVSDAAGHPIVNTSTPLATAFDNGPLTFSSTATGVGTVTAGGTLTQPTTAGTAAYTTHCIVSTGAFLTSLTPASTTGSGDVTGTELGSRGLTYPASVAYVPSVYTCSAGTNIAETRIYVGQYPASTISAYAAGASGAAAPIATIGGTNTGMGGTVRVAFDSSGRIYVPNYYIGTVTIYAPNPVGSLNEAPLATIAGPSTGLANPNGLTVDSSGRIFVANVLTSVGITIYAPYPAAGNEAPIATIGGANTAIATPVGVTIDPNGRIYVTAYIGNVTVYAPYPASGNEAPVATIGGGSTGIANPYDAAFDASGRVYVPNANTNTVTIYAANPVGNVTSAPLATIGGANTGLSTPDGVVLDASGRVYVSNNGAGTVTVYAAYPAAGNESPIATIVTGGAYGIAIR